MDPYLAGAYLTIDLGAIVANYKYLAAQSQTAECAAVVKADAYGLGMEKVATALAKAGCRRFFVALPAEGLTLRRLLPDVSINVLNGLMPGAEALYLSERLTPVLNSYEEIVKWAELCRARGPHPSMLHLETGIHRLGLQQSDIEKINRDLGALDGLEVTYLMSHLACADIEDHTKNQAQLDEFERLKAMLPDALSHLPCSVANSSAIFLGPEFQMDLMRPGIALYGGNPVPKLKNPMQPVARLQGKILQVHDVDREMTVGYGATHRMIENGRIATVSVGYADGYLRSLGNTGFCGIGEFRVPVVGRVSMDMITIDVTAIPQELSQRGSLVDLIGGSVDLDEIAKKAGTISYEMLTSLGSRYNRHYEEAEN